MSESNGGDGSVTVCGDSTLPWGRYIPPSAQDATHSPSPPPSDGDNILEVEMFPEKKHDGYIQIIDSKGKAFPCAFTRPIGSVTELVVSKKRKNPGGESDGDNGVDGEQEETYEEVTEQKRTISEQRLHPEEGLFLQMRGLFRIESRPTSTEAATKEQTMDATMSTQQLFSTMLPECNIPLAAYLAFAHLRSQGYILIRYSDKRIELLSALIPRGVKHTEASSEDLEGDKDDTQGDDEREDETNDDKEGVVDASKIREGDGIVPTSTSDDRSVWNRKNRTKLSDDVATASPPSVVSLEGWSRSVHNDSEETANPRLAYYAYNPNARFRRSNPGLPNFGVAILPYYSGDGQGPTFEVLASLVSSCKVEPTQDGIDRGNMPLRLLTVADGGAVVVFGATKGEVPSINSPKS